MSSLTTKMLEKFALLGNERMMHDLLIFDDFNYEPFNKAILDINVKLESIENDQALLTYRTDSITYGDITSDRGSQHLKNLPEGKNVDELVIGIKRGSESSGESASEKQKSRVDRNMRLFNKQQKIYIKEH